MVACLDSKSEPNPGKSQLSEKDARLILFLCTELIALCAKFANKIDPAAAAMITYVADEIKLYNKL